MAAQKKTPATPLRKSAPRAAKNKAIAPLGVTPAAEPPAKAESKKSAASTKADTKAKATKTKAAPKTKTKQIAKPTPKSRSKSKPIIESLEVPEETISETLSWSPGPPPPPTPLIVLPHFENFGNLDDTPLLFTGSLGNHIAATGAEWLEQELAREKARRERKPAPDGEPIACNILKFKAIADELMASFGALGTLEKPLKLRDLQKKLKILVEVWGDIRSSSQPLDLKKLKAMVDQFMEMFQRHKRPLMDLTILKFIADRKFAETWKEFAKLKSRDGGYRWVTYATGTHGIEPRLRSSSFTRSPNYMN